MKMLRPNGTRIAELRKQKGLTQADCKIDAKTLRKIERGEPTREQTMRRLAEVLRVRLEEIVHADEVAAVQELDAFRQLFRENNRDADVVVIDRYVHSPLTEELSLEAIDEGQFVDAIRAAEVLKWHVDLVDPSPAKLEYLAKVSNLVDHFRIVVRGLSGLQGSIAEPERPYAEVKERDLSFSDAFSREKKAIELRSLIKSSKDRGIRFCWVFYTFRGYASDFQGNRQSREQRVTLVVATDSDRDKLQALVPRGISPHHEPSRSDGNHSAGDDSAGEPPDDARGDA